MTQYNTNYTSVATAVKELGEAKVLNVVNTALANLNYRAQYNATKNTVMKIAKTDPRFADIVKTAKTQVRNAVK